MSWERRDEGLVRYCPGRGEALTGAVSGGRPRGRSTDDAVEELRQSSSSRTVRFKLVSRTRLLDRILGEAEPPTSYDDFEDVGTMVHGWALLVLCVLVLGGMIYSVVASFTDPGIKRSPKDPVDEFGVAMYYCLLGTLSIPVFLVFVYWNWLSMKVFIHAPTGMGPRSVQSPKG